MRNIASWACRAATDAEASEDRCFNQTVVFSPQAPSCRAGGPQRRAGRREPLSKPSHTLENPAKFGFKLLKQLPGSTPFPCNFPIKFVT